MTILMDRPPAKDTSRLRMALMRHRQRSERTTAEIEARKREYLERQRAKHNNAGCTLPTAQVLQDWHIDEHGFLARSVGRMGGEG